MNVEDATQADLPGIRELINHAITTGVAVFDETPKTVAEVESWFAAKQKAELPVLVVRDAAGVAGYASYGPFRPWGCYRFTVEHGVHVRTDVPRRGLGKKLLEALTERARAAGMHVMVGGIEGSNDASLQLHRELGFVESGRLPEVGRKFDKWLTLIFMQKTL